MTPPSPKGGQFGAPIKINDHRSGQTKQILARNTDVEDNQDIIRAV